MSGIEKSVGMFWDVWDASPYSDSGRLGRLGRFFPTLSGGQNTVFQGNHSRNLAEQ
jgi:hypothetical protein